MNRTRLASLRATLAIEIKRTIAAALLLSPAIAALIYALTR